MVRKAGQARNSKAQIQEQSDVLKAKLDGKEQLRANLEEQLRELEENNYDLRGKLVQSPDRLHAEINDIEKKNSDRAQLIQDCEYSINKMEQQMQILSTEADRHLDCFKKEFDAVKKDIIYYDQAKNSRNELLMALDREKESQVKLEGKKAELARRFENDLSDLNSRLQRCQNKIEHIRGLISKNNE